MLSTWRDHFIRTKPLAGKVSFIIGFVILFVRKDLFLNIGKLKTNSKSSYIYLLLPNLHFMHKLWLFSNESISLVMVIRNEYLQDHISARYSKKEFEFFPVKLPLLYFKVFVILRRKRNFIIVKFHLKLFILNALLFKIIKCWMIVCNYRWITRIIISQILRYGV